MVDLFIMKNNIATKKKIITLLSVIFVSYISFGCASSNQAKRVDSFESGESTQNSKLNQRIVESASKAPVLGDAEYLLGAGDIIEVTVFQVEELNKKVRVNGRGQIILPLLGTIDVAEKSVAEVETVIVDKLAADFLQNPQVSVFIDEYRSQQITVMGAVENPNVYNVRQSRSIFEMLSLAGGITDVASDKLRVKTMQLDQSTGEKVEINLVLSMTDMLEGGDSSTALRLGGGDSILVPEAGVVFVEGAVKKPGAYKMEGETDVLKAIALAGGIPWEAKQSSIKVVRKVNGSPVSVEVDLEAIRKQKGDNVVLKDGDVVVVGYNVAKRALSGFFNTVGSIFGYSLN